MRIKLIKHMYITNSIKSCPLERNLKIPLLLLFLSLLTLTAVNAKTLTKTYPKQMLETRLLSLSKDYGVNIGYRPEQCHNEVTEITLNNATVEQALDKTLVSETFTWQKKSENSYIVTQKEQKISTTKSTKSGKLSGVILDEKGEPLPGAAIYIVEIQNGVSSNINGDFTINNIASGTYTVEVSFISYQKQTITNVVVESGKTTPLNVQLKPATTDIGEVEVTAEYHRETVQALYALQQKNVTMTDGISADLIKNSTANNVAQVLEHVSGVTVNNGKNVVVRGMGDRYNNMLLNGVSLPSTEPNRKNFSFDIIPSALVDNVVVAKTFTPDMPGEFAGGTVNVSTLSLPQKPFLNLSVGSGYNTISTGKDFYSTHRFREDYFLGNKRDWYGNTWKLNEYNNYVYGAFVQDFEKAGEMNAKIPNHWGMKKYTGMPTQSYSLVGGVPIDLSNGQKLGFTMALTYRHEEKHEHIEEAGFRNADRNMVEDMGDRYNFITAVGAIANAKWQSEHHSVAWHNLFNNRFTLNSLQRVVFDENRLNMLTQYSSPMINRLIQTQIEGKHEFHNQHILVDWTGGYSKVNRQQPEDLLAVGGIQAKDKNDSPVSLLDNQYIVGWTGSVTGDIAKFTNGHIRNTALEESKTDFGVNIEYNFTVANKTQKFKAGYRSTLRRSDYAQQYLRPQTQLSKDGYEWNKTGILTIHQLYDSKNLASGKLAFLPFGLNGNVDDAYRGEQDLHAIYAMTEIKPLDKLTLIGGVRVEANDMRTITEIHNYQEAGCPYIGDSIITERTTDYMPSATAIFEVTPKLNARIAYSKTLARPDFRELAQIHYYDVNSMATYSSSKAIEPTHTDNVDLRFEWYPSAGEIISLSVFYKKFKKPVETLGVMQQDGYNYNFKMVNLDQSESQGLELNLRKNFSFLGGGDFFKNLYLTANAMVMKANVQYNYIDLTAAIEQDDIDPDFNRDRPLQGLAPYTVNAGLNYQGKYWGFATNYGRTGRKLVISGAAANLDEYENPRDVIDLQLRINLLEGKMGIKANAGDILNQSYIIYRNGIWNKPDTGYEYVEMLDDMDYNEGDYIIQKYKKGINFSLSVSYSF